MNSQWAIAHVSPGAIVGEHKDCGGEIVVESEGYARCEKCLKAYRLTLRAELEAV